MIKNNIEVPALARVEGEGALYIRLKDGTVSEIQLNIYEPPRFFEGFLRSRHFQEVPDITARICGICPVAYQMSAVQALEMALGASITPEILDLRRLMYAAEYIESHALHIYMLQAPDLLGHESALSLAEVAPDIVKRALKLKKTGNDLLKAIGGRSVHPVNACVGGFYSWPKPETVRALIPDLEWALEASIETARWAASLPYPDFEVYDFQFVAVTNPDEYGMYSGDILSSTGNTIPVSDFEKEFIESHIRHSNALHSHTTRGDAYITGPLARLNLNYQQLRPEAQQVMEEIDLELPLQNPYKALLARAVELVQVCVQAIQLAQAYQPQGPCKVEVKPRAGEGCGASEAPRGLLYHHYVLDEAGKVLHARIVPPTAQNLARIEADLWKLAPVVLNLPQADAVLACEHLVRSYDPCISCATHFLNLEIIRE
jgi:sulfhydrogenase subunit alpha